MSLRHKECRREADVLSRAIGDQHDFIIRLAAREATLSAEERQVLTSARDLRDEFNDRLRDCTEDHGGMHFDAKSIALVIGQTSLSSLARIAYGLSGNRPPEQFS